MNVANGFSRLRRSFATLDVCKLVVRQIEADGAHGLLDMSLVLLQHFGIRIQRWRFLRSVHNIPKIHGCQQYFYFELLNIELIFVELINDFSGLTLKSCHPIFEYTLKKFKQYISHHKCLTLSNISS